MRTVVRSCCLVYETIAFIVSEEVIDNKDVWLLMNELQVGIKNIYSLKVGIGKIPIQGKVGISWIGYSSVCIYLLIARGVDCCGRRNSTIPKAPCRMSSPATLTSAA